MQSLQFRNQDLMPILGLGTWKSEPNEVYRAIREAIKIGYRHIDCASAYLNETEIGNALNDAISEGDVTREELWITSKLWCNAHGAEDVAPALQKTLDDLQLEYLDLYLMHWPVAFRKEVFFPENGKDLLSLEEVPLAETWSAMEACVLQHLTRHIGVSNFSIGKLKDLNKKAQIRIEVNQIELHPFLQQDDMLQFCREQNIHLTAYSPLGSIDRSTSLKKKNEPSLMADPVLKAIASEHNCTVAQLLIAWSVKREVSVIPKSTNPTRIRENFEAMKIDLNKNDMDRIRSLDKNYRYIDGRFFALKGSPYSMEGIWA